MPKISYSRKILSPIKVIEKEKEDLLLFPETIKNELKDKSILNS